MTRPRLSFALATALLALSGALPGCRDRGARRAEPSAASLRPYDFQGHTRWKLARLCDAAARAEGSDAATRQLRCAETLLDWFLLAVLREDSALQEGLATFLAGGQAPPAGVGRGARILEALAARFRAAMVAGGTGGAARRAAAGLALVELQRTESTQWGYAYLHGLAEAARPGAPFALQARVIIAGAALDGLKTAAKAAPHLRAQVLVQGLGFPCPAEAEAARAPEDAPRRPPTCPLACPGLREAVHRLAPDRRKALIAAQCPLAWLGLAHREQGVYLSEENLLVTKALAFQLGNLKALRAERDHPLVEALGGALATLGRRLEQLRVPLGLPELSTGEPIHFPVPLCASADEPVTAPVVLAIDETRLRAGTVPILAARGGAVTFLDLREGLQFPGRAVPVADRAGLGERLREIRAAYARMLGPGAPAHADRVAIYGASELSAGRLADLLDMLVGLGVRRAELVLRNTTGALRAVPVTLALRRRGEGAPLAGAASPAPPPDQAPLRLELGPSRLRLRATAGPLQVSPLAIPAGDLAGLRETLEKTRRAYRNASGVEVQLDPAVPYRDLARLLHHLRRNSSGRTLYPTLIL